MALRKFKRAGMGGQGADRPTGERASRKKWQSPMALRKFDETVVWGVREPTGLKRQSHKMAKSNGIAEVW